jgi:ABC-2 type transport system ATP-binding protein
MSRPLVEMEAVSKSYRFFTLSDICLQLMPGQIMGFVGPNGAGKSTTLKLLMALIRQDSGDIRALGHPMPDEQAQAKRDIGYMSEDMRLYLGETLAWHMKLIASIYPGWDAGYAETLLHRFNLKPPQPIKSLSHGERVKATLLLVLARRPRLLVLDEPTTGLDPVARHELLTEFMDVLSDERRGIIFSSHNTQDVEQISDQITFIDRGRIIESRDKETFLDRWRRLQLDVPPGVTLPSLPQVTELSASGRLATATTNDFSEDVTAAFAQSGAVVREIQRMTLEEIFVANVMSSRKDRAA